jgi:hypothetical protein
MSLSPSLRPRARLRVALRVAVACCVVLTSGAALAQTKTWHRIGTVTTQTPGQLCYTNGTDMVCDSNAPSLFGTNIGIGSTLPVTSLDDSQNYDAIALPGGSNAQRPTGTSLVNGEIRYNTTGAGQVEAYYNGAWNTLISTASLGTSLSAAGSNGQVQYNNNGNFGGAAGITYASSGNNVTLVSQHVTDVPLVVQGAGAASLTNGQVAYWKFDENTGTTVNDASGNGYTGTFNGTTGSQWTTGEINYGLSFNGSNNYVSASWNNLTGNAARTISAWFKTNNTNSANWVSWGTSSTNYLSQIGIYSGGIGYLGYNNDLTVSAAPYADNNWHHLVVTFDGANMVLYIDGTSKNTGAKTLATGTSGINIGRAINGTNYYTGNLDEVGIWNRALSQGEITALYNRGSGRQYPYTGANQTGNLASFLNGTGTTLANIDASGDITSIANVTGAALIPSGTSAPANGIYLPSSNTLGLATNSTTAMVITGSGNIGVGTTNPTSDVKADINGAAQISGTGSESCAGAADVGKMRFNPSKNYFEICSP